MILLLQAAPLVVLVALLAAGRAGPVAACLVALLLAVPAVMITVPEGVAVFLGHEALRGAFLAAQPIGVVAGGLLFHAAVARDAPPGGPVSPRRVFAATLLAGNFLESVTGFAVGAVFALSALRGMAIGGAVAGAMALLSLSTVPWGGLGPGTSLGAALIGLPAQGIAQGSAWPNAVWLLVLGPVLWRLCGLAGIAVDAREKAAQFGLLGVMAGILLVGNYTLPFEVVGILAAGLPLLWVLWRLDPPRDAAAWRAALGAMAPYLVLTVALLAARAVPAPALRPWGDLPGFPLTHVAVVLGCVATVLLLMRPHPGRVGLAALRRAGRPALAMLLYVVLARWLAGSGVAAALAQAVAEGLGPLAPYAVPPLGLLSGIVTGSNVGSNAALMPVQAGLGAAAGMPELLAPALHNFAGAAGAGMSFGVTALICGLLADGTRPAQLWRLLAPSLVAVVVIGWGCVWWLG